MRERSERGAVAVEFALLAPVLILLLFGITEFGRAYNVQISLSNAARRRRACHGSQQRPGCCPKCRPGALGTLVPVLADNNIVFIPPPRLPALRPARQELKCP